MGCRRFFIFLAGQPGPMPIARRLTAPGAPWREFA
jgi:hypothetical protein